MEKYAKIEEAKWWPINANDPTNQQHASDAGASDLPTTDVGGVSIDNPRIIFPETQNVLLSENDGMMLVNNDAAMAELVSENERLKAENDRYRAYVVRNNEEKKQLYKDVATLTSFVAFASAAISQLLVNEHLVEAQAYFKPIIAQLKKIDPKKLMGSYKEIFAVVKMIKVDEIKSLTEKIHQGFDTTMFSNLPLNSVIDICDRYKVNINGFHDIKAFYAKNDDFTEGVQLELPPDFQNTLI